EFRATSESSFPHRWESRSVRTGTYAPSFPRKRKSRPFGTETYRIKRFL
ncbi:pilin, partial [Neisseria meningitidis]|nr:pilin [Neisseria meningitidis]